MLHFAATNFVRLGIGLRQLRADAQLNSLMVPADEPCFNPARYLDHQGIARALDWLEKIIEPPLRELGLTISAETAQEIISELKKADEHRLNCQWLKDQSKALEKLIRKSYSSATSSMCRQSAPSSSRATRAPVFGEPVATAFPSAISDIRGGRYLYGPWALNRRRHAYHARSGTSTDGDGERGRGHAQARQLARSD
jgi:hypothetical protein